jgi:[lysine-biosynthesis-protein LysW]---L-2-aminoadipate ligase
MKFAVVAHRRSATNDALVAAAAGLGLQAEIVVPRRALTLLEPGDVALARLDVREELDGIERGTGELERLAAGGVDVRNPPAALVVAHDKLLTARTLRHAGLPHPHTTLISAALPAAVPELPLVLKPRFGSWGRDVTLCRDRAELIRTIEGFAFRPWFRETGGVLQDLVPPVGHDLRIIVAGGRIVGAARRDAAPGEWRTNVALGGTSSPANPPVEACVLALSAADAVGADLLGVDLLPGANGSWWILELNGAVDFKHWYGPDVFAEAVDSLLGEPAAA